MAKTGQAAATVTSGPSNAEALSTAGREADGATAVSSGGGGRWTGGGRAAGVTGSSGKSAGSVASSIRRGDEASGRPTTGTMTGRGVSTTTSGPEVVGVVSAVPVADDASLLLGALDTRPSGGGGAGKEWWVMGEGGKGFKP